MSVGGFLETLMGSSHLRSSSPAKICLDFVFRWWCVRLRARKATQGSRGLLRLEWFGNGKLLHMIDTLVGIFHPTMFHDGLGYSVVMRRVVLNKHSSVQGVFDGPVVSETGGESINP